jgi:hypothetical protein
MEQEFTVWKVNVDSEIKEIFTLTSAEIPREPNSLDERISYLDAQISRVGELQWEAGKYLDRKTQEIISGSEGMKAYDIHKLVSLTPEKSMVDAIEKVLSNLKHQCDDSVSRLSYLKAELSIK